MIVPQAEGLVHLAHNAWDYKGWRIIFHQPNEYHIHGPKSRGRRARKIVFRHQEAISYIDQRRAG